MPSTTCQCGCGNYIPAGNTFFPAHQLRHARSLRASAHDGDVYARQELYRRGWTLENTTTIPTFAFGMEAEFFGMSHGYAADSLSEAGIYTEADGYHHEVKGHWRITEDGSVSGEGCELVSPILVSKNKEHISTSRKALDVLRGRGGQVNASCGLHVHHNLRGKTVVDIAETCAHWAGFQSLIETILPRSRRNGPYSNSMRDGANWYRSVAQASGVTGPKDSPEKLAHGGFGRYHAVNLQAISDHNTIEYRQHSGTLNPNKLENWLIFTRAMHDVAKKGTYSTLLSIYGSDAEICAGLGLDGMMDYLGVPSKVKKFYQARTSELYPNGTAGYAHGTDDEDVGDYNDDEYHEFEDGEEDDEGRIYCTSCSEWHYDE